MDVRILVFLAFTTAVRSRDLIVGSTDGGHKIYDQNKKASPAIWRQSENVTIVTNNGEVISKLIITDLREEKDGDAKIVDGGEGKPNVTIELKSPTVLRGYDFHIEAYSVSGNGNNDQDNRSTQTVTEKDQRNSNTSPSLPISVGKDLLSTTSEKSIGQSIMEETNAKRLSRDVENKDKSTEQSSLPLGAASTSTEVSPLHSVVGEAINSDNKANHDNINKHNIQLQEVSKMPESTVKTIPLSEFGKQEENKNHQDGQPKFDMVRHTNVDYPHFNVYEVKTNATSNNESGTTEQNNKNTRQKRDLVAKDGNIPVVNIKNNSDTFKNDGDTHITETKNLNRATQSTNQENVDTNTRPLSTTTNNDNIQNVAHVHHHSGEEPQLLGQEKNHYQGYRGRYIPSRFEYSSTNLNHNSELSTTPLPITLAGKTAINGQNTNFFQVSTPNIPKSIANEVTTVKVESSTEIKPLVLETSKNNDRSKRDTTELNKTDQKLSFPQLPLAFNSSSASTTTVQPVIYQKSDTNPKIPIEVPFATNGDRTDDLKRDAKVTNVKNLCQNANGQKIINDRSCLVTSQKTGLLDSSTTTIPEVTEALKNTEPQPEIMNHINKANENTDNKERITRDTNIVKTSEVKPDEKQSTPTDIAKDAAVTENTQKSDKKVEEIENKSTTSAAANETHNKDFKDQKLNPITEAINNKDTIESEGNSKSTDVKVQDTTNSFVKDQPSKFTREAITSNLQGNKGNLTLPTDLITLVNKPTSEQKAKNNESDKKKVADSPESKEKHLTE
ncbi:probable serine/threonine-protein kinase DDB_G0282963 [Battus philenor]|uniref:probable serine/threonine-protein kinase DDB_G0282963 n=1 Tax=Battus philenor TaxID=42288 RepID=UPI0035CF0F30